MVAKKKDMEFDATAQVETAVAAGKETVEKVVKVGQEVAQKSYEQAMQLTKENVEKASKAFFVGYDEFAVVTKDNYDAYLAAVNVWTKGIEAMGKEVFAFTQSSVEKGVETGKSMLTCKTLNEVVDLQNEFAKSAFDNAVSEATKLSEMSVKTANEAFAPLQSRVNVTIEKLSKPIAA